MARTERESDSRRMRVRLVVAAETSNKHAEWRRLQQRNLSILGLPKRKEWPQCHREKAVGKNTGAALVKMKRDRVICPKHQIMRGERVKVGKSRTLAREGGSEREHGVERVDSTVKEGRFLGGQGGKQSKASLEEVEGSMSG